MATSLTEYKKLIEKYKLLKVSEGYAVYSLETSQLIVPENKLQEQDLNELIDKLIFINAWIKSSEPGGFKISDEKNSFGYDDEQYKSAFSSASKKDFDAIIEGMMKFLEGKKKDEITIEEFIEFARTSNSEQYLRICSMFDTVSPVNYRISAKSFNALKNIAEWEISEKHPLVQYRKLLERYIVESTYDPSAIFKYGYVIKDRKTGKLLYEDNKDKKKRLRERIAFAKDWLMALKGVVPHAGNEIEGDKFGYDENLWCYAFNDGAKKTYDKLIQIFKNNDGKKITYEDVSEQISKIGPDHYEHEDSIIDYFFKIRHSWVLNIPIENSLNEDAGTNVRIVGDVVPGTELNLLI